MSNVIRKIIHRFVWWTRTLYSDWLLI